MTMIVDVLKAMADGKPRTSFELMEITGLPRPQLEGAIAYLCKLQMTEVRPLTYSITEDGIKRAEFKAPVKEKATPKPRKVKKPRKSRAIEVRRTPTETMVQRSIKKNANSVFAMGGMP